MEPRALIEGEDGSLWIAMPTQLLQFVDGRTEPYQPPSGGRFGPDWLLRDREGGLWIGTTTRGVLHLHGDKTDQFGAGDGLSGDFVGNVFEDREGNIWVATLDGLDRFRDYTAPTISVKQGLSNATVVSVLARKNGSVWIGTSDGLTRWSKGQITTYRTRDGLPSDAVVSLGEDDQGRIWTSTQRGLVYFEQGRFVPVPGVPGGFVESIVEEPAGNIWISHQKEGLFHLQYDTLIAKIPWAKLGLKENAPWLVPDPTVGLWLGFFNGGVAYLKDGQVRESYTAADGLGKGFVSHLRFDREGALWAATEGGLSRLKDGRIATLSSKNGLPCDAVQWSIEDNDQALWLQTPCGLLQVARSDLDGWAADPNHRVNATVFDSSEGVRSPGLPIGYSPVVSKATDGKLWFVTYGGAGVIDPRHLAVNKLPPPVHIEEVKVDGKVWDASHGWRLPALVRDVTIHYTALSFVAPEKIHFRYKLEGQDPDWKEVVNNREAQYTNLKPRNYRFRVMACNNSGVWNEAGDFLDFSVAPAYYQTTWFRLSCVAAFFALLWALYRYRLHQIGQEFAVRMAERTRIARELHDTLLQNFQGSLLVMQTARNILSRRPEQAGQTLDDAINMATGAVAEGRDAIQDLRSQPTVQSDLEQLLTATGQDLVHSGDANGNPVIFRVAVEGARQALDPIIQDEVYRITRELLRNAFRHSRASQIEADIRYDDRLLRVLIRDDGKGIDPKVVEAGGRAGHWGLSGMRERAKRIGARLEFWSEAGAGTEVALSIPASIAYGTSRNSRSFPLLRRKKANP
jgi:signal transduction histidine kinase/streptogramin lyase